MRQSPEWASNLGDRRFNDRWSDNSMEAIARAEEHNQDLLGRLAKIDRASLPAGDRLNYDLFLKRAEKTRERHRFHEYLIPLNQRDGIQTTSELAESLRFETVKDYEDWLARLNAFPVLMDQTIALMRQGIRERMVHPKVIIPRLPGETDKQIVDHPPQNPHYQPFPPSAQGR